MRNVIVTGGSRGLGLAVVRLLASQGYRAIAIARAATSEMSALVKGGLRGWVEFVPFDLAEIEKLRDLVRRIHSDYGPIYGLVNNAAIGSHGALAMMSACDIEAQLRLNTMSPIVLTKHVVRRMMADGGGRIVNVASVAALTGYSGLSVYSATKSAMIGFTRSLAREVGSLGVNVNVVAPGFMETEMTRAMDTKRRERLMRRSALRRFPCVGEVADAIVYLLSESARAITGTVVTIDAGSIA